MNAVLLPLRQRFVAALVAVFVLIGALAMLFFASSTEQIINYLGRNFAARQAEFDRERILGPLLTEIALARKLADSPMLKSWAINESDVSLRKAALSGLESYRTHFHDQSFFFVPVKTGNYYFNDRPDKAIRITQVVRPEVKEDSWFFAAIRSPQVVQLNVDPNLVLGKTKVWINVQMREGNKVIAMAGTGIDLGDFTRSVVTGATPGVYGILIDTSGAIQIHPDAALIDFNTRAKASSERRTIFTLLLMAANANACRKAWLGSSAAAARSKSCQSRFPVVLNWLP